MKTELQDTNDFKQQSFHGGDSAISVEDLWNKWEKSEGEVIRVFIYNALCDINWITFKGMVLT